MYDIEYNGTTARSHGLYVVKRPSIPPPEEELATYKIGGRDGILTGNRRLGALVFSLEMGFRAQPIEWAEKFRLAKGWLSGSGILKQNDDSDYFFKVYTARINSVERNVKRIGTFTVEFTCDPYMYRVDGQQEYDPNEVIENLYDESHPIFKLIESGTIGMNNHSAHVDVDGTTYVDTDRMVTYRSDKTLANTSLTGNYADLYLKAGTNTITVPAGTKIIPNWRKL